MDEKTKEKAKKSQFGIVTSDEEGIRLDRWFKRRFPEISHGQLQKWLRTGQIRLNGKRADSSVRLQEGDVFRLPPLLWKDVDAAKAESGEKRGRPLRRIEKLKAFVLYEDADVVVINKPSGLAVQGGTGLKENLDDSLMALSADGETKPKLVHRLDRDTSGVLLIARNDFAAMRLAASFRSRKTRKIYWAATRGVPEPEEGEIDASLVKNGQVMRVAKAKEERDGAKTAQTLYKVVEKATGRMAFVVLWPLTGRTHQIRVHLAHVGTPILGDPLYGGLSRAEEALPAGELGSGLHLHARRLIIPHPRRGVIDVTAPLPPAMRKTWRWMGFEENDTTDFEESGL